MIKHTMIHHETSYHDAHFWRIRDDPMWPYGRNVAAAFPNKSKFAGNARWWCTLHEFDASNRLIWVSFSSLKRFEEQILKVYPDEVIVKQ